MQKIKDVKEYVEKIDATKKVNPKDLSSDQDLTIALMNLISIEEHLMFSGAKTGKTSYYDLIEQVRETRKNLMQKVIPEYEGEVWCISKHLLSSSMRLMEVGTKQQSLGHKEEAYSLFDTSYELYCLFWGLNMKLLDVQDVKWVEDSFEDVKKIAEDLEENMGSDDATEEASETEIASEEEIKADTEMTAEENNIDAEISEPVEEPKEELKEEAKEEPEEKTETVAEVASEEKPEVVAPAESQEPTRKKSALSRMKAFVRKAVDCCIE